MGSYVFKPYDPIFPQLFDDEKKRIQSFFEKDYQIEHVGSTAVPGLGGKGIIDICLVVPEEDKEKVWNALVEAGYTLRPDFTPESHVSHVIYLPDPIEEKRKYHIHIRGPKSQWLKEAIAFRDYLRNHPEDVKRYADIKKKAAEMAAEDKDKYLVIKGPIIDDILKKALKELNKG